MRKSIIYFSVLILLFCNCSLFPQTKEIDSLKSIVLKVNKDTNYVNALNELANKFMRRGVFDTAMQYAQLSNETARSIKFKNGLARSFIHAGNINYCQGILDKALENYAGALEIKKDLGDKKGMASALMGMGNVYNLQGNYQKALEIHLDGLRLKEELQDTKGMADSYINIGNIYNGQKNFDQALIYYELGLKTMQKTGNKKNIADTYNNIGNVKWGQKKYEAAIKNYQVALQITKEIGDKQGVGRAYHNLGAVYDSQKKYKDALQNFFEGLKLREEIGDREGIENSLVSICATYARMKDYAMGELYGKKALALAKEVGDKQVIKTSYENLAEIYRATGRLALALETYVNFIATRDSLINEENTKNLVRLEMNYEFNKKEAVLKLEQEKKESIQKAELRRHRQINWFITGFTLLLLVIIALVFNRRRLKEKNKFQAQLNKQQKEQANAVMETQESERKRIAEDLHDSLGHLLSTAKLNLQTQPIAQKQIDGSLNLLNQASEEIRNITFNLMPRTLEEGGLIPALNELAVKVTNSGTVKVLLHVHDMEKFILEKQSQFNIYRIVQEAVNNILKHASASEINIQVLGQTDHITIMIEDDGKGFNPEINKGGRGLKNIVTRSLWLKGNINIDSTPGRGTTITTEFPI